MGSTATLVTASVGLLVLLGLMVLVEEYAGRIARWIPYNLRAEHLRREE